MGEWVIAANGYGVQAVVVADDDGGAWSAFCDEYEPASARSNYTVATRDEHDSAEDFARRMNRRRQNGDLVGTVEVLDAMQEGPSGVAAFLSQRSA